MLVLSRRLGERVLIGEDIIVEVVEVRGNRVRLAFSAPDYVTIAREELLPLLAAESEPPQKRPLGACA